MFCQNTNIYTMVWIKWQQLYTGKLHFSSKFQHTCLTNIVVNFFRLTQTLEHIPGNKWLVIIIIILILIDHFDTIIDPEMNEWMKISLDWNHSFYSHFVFIVSSETNCLCIAQLEIDQPNIGTFKIKDRTRFDS